MSSENNIYDRALGTLSTREQLLEMARDHLWGAYGPDGSGPIRNIPFISLETDHILNILMTQTQLSVLSRRILIAVLEERGVVPWPEGMFKKANSSGKPKERKPSGKVQVIVERMMGEE